MDESSVIVGKMSDWRWLRTAAMLATILILTLSRNEQRLTLIKNNFKGSLSKKVVGICRHSD